ncbi:hypothetical protein [Streptomyces sp. cg2]|uniref:hypothetical protein n=1 Tax=Streptomyces sp. cg2 TaxID=3238799 RepID=UPI0034E2EF95
MSEPNRISVEQLLAWASRFDVPETQREMVVSVSWTVQILNSLVDGFPIGTVLLWRPEERGHRPLPRYREDSGADWWIVDGQQIFAAMLAAFAVRPPWIPEDRWRELGGPSLEVGVRLDGDGGFAFRPHQPGKSRQVSLRALREAAAAGRIRSLVLGLGVPSPDPQVERLAALLQRLMDAQVSVEWLRGDQKHAVEAFLRHNRAGQAHPLTGEESRLAVLSTRRPGLQLQVIDPVVRRLAAEDFAGVLGRRQVVAVMQSLLPDHYRRISAATDPALIDAAARSAGQACLDVAAYLRRYGIVAGELLSPVVAAEVLGVLFACFPQASGEDFAARWLAHVAVTGRYFSPRQRASADVRMVRSARTLSDAYAALAAEMPAGCGISESNV